MNRQHYINALREASKARVITAQAMRDIDHLYTDAAINGPLGILVDPVFVRYIRLIDARHNRTSYHAGFTPAQRRLAAFASHREIEISSRKAALTGDSSLGRKAAHPVLRFGSLIRDLFSYPNPRTGHTSATMAVSSATPAGCYAVARGCSPTSAKVH
ncbi:hypothetical protein QKW35_13530 [Pontibacterium granulatum]|uniref:hypothetical protein n=1 Tax=Pontibacterium granulatum TaxID=2036029 RepID=UPI00249A6849|nr:hypothetical protein [Pontibacterium granulatum]MDI3325398.1 hypothetical protein [Pontibacterium granulatum]